jgi:hypothetical protein
MTPQVSAHLATLLRSPRTWPWPPAIWKFIEASAIYGLALAMGAAVLILLFRLGVFSGIEILFYRSIVLCILASVISGFITLAVGRYWHSVTMRDAVAVGLILFGFNLNLMSLGPVTFDRSNSVFILSVMTESPDHVYSVDEMDQIFRKAYLTDMHQIARRFEEQTATGTVTRVPSGFVISDKGKGFVKTARDLSWLFGTSERLLRPVPGVTPNR